MDDFDSIWWVLLLVFVLLSWLRGARRRPPASPEAAGAGGVPATHRAHRVEATARRLAELEARAEHLPGSLGDLDPQIAERLATVVGEEVLPEIRELGKRAAGVRSARDLRAIDEQTETLEELITIVQTMARQRRDPETRAVLGDADALAEACYRPIIDFCRHHGIPIRSHFPLAVFRPGGTTIRPVFLRYRLAPIALPPNYATQLWRWPSIAHEIAHDLVAAIPRLHDELVEQLGVGEAQLREGESEAGPEAPSPEEALFGPWMEEIFADAIGSLLIGPAYLRSMVALFARPDSPIDVTSIRISEGGFVDWHPPRHLRVHMTARFLERMGYRTRAGELQEWWDRVHGAPETLVLLSGGSRQRFLAGPLIEVGRGLMDRLYLAEIEVLAGHRLADISGLEFASAHMNRAERAREQLARGRPAAFDARSLIAAATEASLDAPDRREVIREAVQRSIVGVGTEERVARVRAMAAGPFATEAREAYARPEAPWEAPATAPTASDAHALASARAWSPALPLNAERLVDALLLAEIIEAPARRRRRA